MLREEILNDLSRFALENNYAYVEGSFSATVETPEEYSVIDEVEIVIAPTGKYLIWKLGELDDKIVGVMNRGYGRENIEIGSDVPAEDAMAVLSGLATEVIN